MTGLLKNSLRAIRVIQIRIAKIKACKKKLTLLSSSKQNVIQFLPNLVLDQRNKVLGDSGEQVSTKKSPNDKLFRVSFFNSHHRFQS